MVNNVYERSFSYNNAYDTNACKPKIQICLYIMIHMQCKMQEYTMESYTYVTKELLPPTQETKHTPSFPRKRVKVA
jgi:hypothetical protein